MTNVKTRDRRAYNRDYYHATKDRYREQVNATKRLSHHRRKLERVNKAYHIDYDALFFAQEGVCAICKKAERKGHSLCVDHDHSCCLQQINSCGRCVRGLLCKKCNRLLGCAGDDSRILAAAIEYLHA